MGGSLKAGLVASTLGATAGEIGYRAGAPSRVREGAD